jgi:hypothetical protein
MKKLLVALALAAGLLFQPADLPAQVSEQAQVLASSTAEPWLELLDTGKLRESWDVTAPVFQEGVGAEQWEQMVEQVRGALGPVRSRELHRAEFASSPPGSPPGEYLIIEFISEFERLPRAMEAVALVQMEDGSWKVAGSFLQPAR